MQYDAGSHNEQAECGGLAGGDLKSLRLIEELLEREYFGTRLSH